MMNNITLTDLMMEKLTEITRISNENGKEFCERFGLPHVEVRPEMRLLLMLDRELEGLKN